MFKHPVIFALAGIIGIVGTVFAMSDRFIAKATFTEFKEHIIYRLDTIDSKLDLILQERTQK